MSAHCKNMNTKTSTYNTEILPVFESPPSNSSTRSRYRRPKQLWEPIRTTLITNAAKVTTQPQPPLGGSNSSVFLSNWGSGSFGIISGRSNETLTFSAMDPLSSNVVADCLILLIEPIDGDAGLYKSLCNDIVALRRPAVSAKELLSSNVVTDCLILLIEAIDGDAGLYKSLCSDIAPLRRPAASAVEPESSNVVAEGLIVLI